MRKVITESFTTIYDYFDKYGHGDGDNADAGWDNMADAAEILQEELTNAFKDYEFKVTTSNISSIHNDCRLDIDYKDKVNDLDWFEMGITADSVEESVTDITLSDSDSDAAALFTLEALNDVFEKAEARFT